jgi:hypothetical protein
MLQSFSNGPECSSLFADEGVNFLDVPFLLRQAAVRWSSRKSTVLQAKYHYWHNAMTAMREQRLAVMQLEYVHKRAQLKGLA